MIPLTRVFVVLSIIKIGTERCTAELIVVHAIFRHGDRTNSESDTYPTDPYKNVKYSPFGRGKLTDEGRLRAYRLGSKLRQLYGQFLGDYRSEMIEALSAKKQRTQKSLEFVLYGLFPPENINSADSVPYKNYEILKDDKILESNKVCVKYDTSLSSFQKSGKVQEVYKNYSDDLKYISNKTEWNVTDLTKPSILYGILSRQEEWHLKLPNWTDVVYPETLYKMASKNYLILSGTTELKQIGSGYLLQKIVHDTQLKVNASDKVSEERKMYLYSGHEMNIALLLNTLEIFQPHYPPYCSCILIEVHRINNQLGIKIFYENDESIQTGLLKMPNCEEFCPLDKFISFVEKYFPNENSCS